MNSTNPTENISKSVVNSAFKGQIFSDNQEIIIAKKFQQLELKKGDFLLKNGEQVANQYYVESGCLRTFYVDDLGKEHRIHGNQ